MKYFLQIFLLLLLFSSQNSFSRDTYLKNKQICEKQEGVWREYGDNCGDDCYSQLRYTNKCSANITFSCDCGKSRCFSENKCQSIKNFEKKIIKSEKKVKEERKKMLAELAKIAPTISESEKLGLKTSKSEKGNEKSCEKSKGTWQEFTNSCANSCESKITPMICAAVKINSCQCSTDECWSGKECVTVEEFKAGPKN